MTPEKPREIAVRVLERWEKGAHFIEDVLQQAFAKSPLSGPDRGLVQELTYGVVRWKATLDWLIARKTDDRRQATPVRLLLRLGLYQIFWLDRIPDHAAVHETVEMAKGLGLGAKAGFVNAVLRTCLRERQVLERALEDLKSSQPALGYSHPEWLLSRWVARLGKADALRLVRLKAAEIQMSRGILRTGRGGRCKKETVIPEEMILVQCFSLCQEQGAKHWQILTINT